MAWESYVQIWAASDSSARWCRMLAVSVSENSSHQPGSPDCFASPSSAARSVSSQPPYRVSRSVTSRARTGTCPDSILLILDTLARRAAAAVAPSIRALARSPRQPAA